MPWSAKRKQNLREATGARAFSSRVGSFGEGIVAGSGDVGSELRWQVASPQNPRKRGNPTTVTRLLEWFRLSSAYVFFQGRFAFSSGPSRKLEGFVGREIVCLVGDVGEVVDALRPRELICCAYSCAAH